MSITEYLRRDRRKVYANGNGNGAALRLMPVQEESIASVLVTVTPDEAEVILAERNTHNRPMSQRIVDRYAADMTANRWRFNGDSIKFDRQGRMIDGQHRVKACADSGVPMTVFVITGLDPEAFETLDRGRKRQLGDDLSLAGETNGLCLAAALRVGVAIDDRNSTQFSKVTDEEARDFLNRNPSIRQSASWSNTYHHQFRFIPPRAAAYCHFKFHRIDAGEADRFFVALKTGADLHPGSPILRLRNRLTEGRKSRGQIDVIEAIAITIKAWNHFRVGATIRALIWRSEGPAAEPFPVPI